MNVFVLSTGRCGTVTFAQACKHITNFTTGHESQTRLVGNKRLRYPENHIEVDNRLSWFLGRLDALYKDNAFYVHMIRDRAETARSFARKERSSIIKAYSEGILGAHDVSRKRYDICIDYCETVNKNIEAFLKDKSRKMTFKLDSARNDFSRFYERIKAEGDLSAALTEWQFLYNATKNKKNSSNRIRYMREKLTQLLSKRLVDR